MNQPTRSTTTALQHLDLEDTYRNERRATSNDRSFTDLCALAWTTFQDCVSSGTALTQLSTELAMLHVHLKTTDGCIVSTVALDENTKTILFNLKDGCFGMLGDLREKMERYRSLAPPTMQNDRAYDRQGWINEQVAEWRRSITRYSDILTGLNNSMTSQSTANIVAKLNKYIFERQSGRRSGSVSGKEIESISTYNPEHEDGWEALKKDLADIGITEADISRHRVLILNLLKDAVAAGKLEEPSLGGEEKEDYSLMDIDDDNDNDEGSVEFFEITPDEDSGSMSGVHNTSISAPRSEWFERVLRQGKFRVAKRLLGAADGPHLRDESGRTLLHHAALLGHSNLTGLILDKHADIDVRDNDGWTPLKCAVYKRHVVCARQLIERGADFKRRYGSSQRTLLHSAAGLGHDEIVRMLLDRGALADTQDDGGFTALHIAAWNGCLTTVRLLLEAGARMDIEDWWGDTPASLGRKSPLEAEVREGMVRTILQYSRSRAQDQSSEVRAGLEDKFDQVVEFLMKEDIYDDSSQNNVFETSMVNGNFSDLLRSQSALMSLGEELFEVWMSNSEDATVSIEE